MCQIHGLREEMWKVTFSMDKNETEMVLVLTKKQHRRPIQNVMAIHGEFQHVLVMTDKVKRKIRKVVRKTCAERRKITLLKDAKILCVVMKK